MFISAFVTEDDNRKSHVVETGVVLCLPPSMTTDGDHPSLTLSWGCSGDRAPRTPPDLYDEYLST
jgi:hypothetical protein